MGQNRQVRIVPLLILLALGPVAAVRAASPASPVETAHAEEVLVRRARYPVRIEEGRPGACDGLNPGNVEMLIGGQPAAVEAIERVRLETIHAVLIDTSASMKERARLERATEAARGYVRSLPANEPVLLASFDEDLALHLPPTTDREAFDRALDEVEFGVYTALNDALYHTIRYLGPRPERKVVVVMTDGCDSASLSAHPFATVLDLAEETENLSVFPIGIELPSNCRGGTVGAVAGPDSLLHRLGVVSGGGLFRVKQRGDFSAVFAGIREQLDQEGHVIYRPPDVSEPAGDGRTEGRRRIRIRAVGLKGCHVERAGSSLIIAAAAERTIVALDGAARVETAALPAAVALEVRFPEWWDAVLDGEPGSLTVARGRIRGRLPDLESDAGPLYSERVYRRTGRYRPRLDLYAGYHVRDFELDAPEFGFVRGALTGPVALVGYLLERGNRPFVEDENGEARLGRGWLHGQTLLETRSLLGRALYAQPGYHEWADARLWSMEREDLERLLEQSGMDGPSRRRFVQTVARRGYVPRPRDPQRVLADWLGDLTLEALAAELDREGAAAALGGRSSLSAERVREIWPRWMSWFPPPTRARVIAPLVPVYDAGRDVIGFYRIVLPLSLKGQPPEDLPPASPLGTLLAESLGLDGVRVTTVEYPGVGRALRPLLRRAGRKSGRREVRAVRLSLESADGEQRTVTGYFLLEDDAWSRDLGGDLEPWLACVDPCEEIRETSR